ncbi:ribonuclease II [Pseudoclavibacter sp. RFBJ3]|uniref:RNB domain-containing ribonuclease n=1 Tax=unclassified Pseudoclavibacter TaxID=2615177 RepID=UPI000CE7A91E|nr:MULTISPECIES: RNB domain-containing ribonuclease [unclassified Pseudoclavibacter]PPF86387.1 ribonuclease II [Pseudoclavibacter sp. RFBJ5]PPF95118.1 ribonuclease II [Pseudoclavibacter sp. RFBJ3]PPF97553.1 ribonuclease II [Pseudoclavibacter sp. RFBH5]PPG22793.1 ribonuclease II [Pseudoclavibacter sp. RFBI4]
MSTRAVQAGAAAEVLGPYLERLRTELEIPADYPADARAEAEVAAAHEFGSDSGRHDLRELPFVTLDPVGSRDLDQAFFLRRVEATGEDADGFEVFYAIADVASFVEPGGALDAETHRRALTVYGPDGRFGLHPAVLSEGVASLLPGVDRPAVVWRMRLDSSGALLDDIEVRRSMVRSRAQLDYPSVQARLDAGTADELLGLLAEIGRLRIDAQFARGGATLEVPDQEIERSDDDKRYRLVLREPLACEEFNAQLSLLTGIAAATLQRRAGVGIWRTLDPARDEDVERLRRVAASLGFDWAPDVSYAQFVRTIDVARPEYAAFATEATRLFRGAGYAAFGTPEHPDVPSAASHSAIAAEYAHVTAPLRRLVDRYGTEIALAFCAGEPVPSWVVDALEALPGEMAEGSRRANAYERAAVDLLEAVLLAPRVGEELDGIVVDSSPTGAADAGQAKATVLLCDPAVRARVVGGAAALELGAAVRVRVDSADPEKRAVTLSVA